MTWIFTCNLTCLSSFCGCISPKHPSRKLVASYFWGLHSSNLSRLVSISAHGLVMEYGGFPSSMKSADLPHSQIFTILRYLKHPNNFPRFSPCFLHVFPCVSQFFSQVPPKNLHTAGWPPAVPRHVRGRCWRQPTATWRRSVCSCWWSCRSDTCGSQWMAFRGSKGLVDHWNFCMHMMGIYI